MKWSDKEIQFLKNNYHNLSAKECAEKLDRSVSAIYYRVSSLGLQEDREFWTKEEEEYLKKHYKNTSNPELAEILDKASGEAVRVKANKMGLDKVGGTFWSEEEVQLLKKYYPDYGPEGTQKWINRSYNAIAIKADKLEIRYDGRPDKELIKELYAQGWSTGKLRERFAYSDYIDDVIDARPKAEFRRYRAISKRVGSRSKNQRMDKVLLDLMK